MLEKLPGILMMLFSLGTILCYLVFGLDVKYGILGIWYMMIAIFICMKKE